MTASTVNVLTLDLIGYTDRSQQFAVAVAALCDPPVGYPPPIMLAETGWTILAEQTVWVEDLDPDPGDPKAGRWRWAGVVGCTRTLTGSSDAAVPVLQAVAHWDVTPPLTIVTDADTVAPGSTVGFLDGGHPTSGTTPDDHWRWESHTHAAVTVAAGSTVGPFTVTPIPFEVAGATLGIGPGSAGPGDDGEVVIDSAALFAVSTVAGSYSGSFGSFRPGYGSVLWTPGAGRSWTMGSLDAYDTTLGITDVPVAWIRRRRTFVTFWSPWSPPEPPAAGGWSLALHIGGTAGWHVTG